MQLAQVMLMDPERTDVGRAVRLMRLQLRLDDDLAVFLVAVPKAQEDELRSMLSGDEEEEPEARSGR